MWTMKPGPVGLVEIVKAMSDAFTSQCEVVINDDELMKRLREENLTLALLRPSAFAVSVSSSYARNAKRLSEMLANQPISPKELFLRHSEFVARFGRLPNLDPYGRQLSFVQYYLLDIVLVVVTVLAVVVYVSFRVLRRCFSIVSAKSKKD
ncbi:hypothetical protein OESDEN_16306 [Oesophagostomum dentatum]|uniref:glucuronosyltransferase n=1 Tax=Oesophagostomum dentatum TaxID=61180 RepID=A0A0B1SJC5_OESDE|nr:hypothetical protein OESDEN_16306 [Oesophagostomum dentatum]